MKRIPLIIVLAAACGLLAFTAYAQEPAHGAGNGVGGFLDEDGDGYNDLAPDADGDGIPNGQDEDYVRPEDGTGVMNQFGFLYKWGKVEEFAGHCFGRDGLEPGLAGHFGPGDGDGTGLGVGPGDGTGFGPGNGDCTDDEDGVGGNLQNRGGRR